MLAPGIPVARIAAAGLAAARTTGTGAPREVVTRLLPAGAPQPRLAEPFTGLSLDLRLRDQAVPVHPLMGLRDRDLAGVLR